MKKTSEEILNIASQLDFLVKNEAMRRVAHESSYQDKYIQVVCDLERLIDDSVALLDDYKSQGLSFSTIEAEGYHRAMLTIKNIIDDNKN